MRYDGWDPQQQPLREALCTLGNGYFATRGAFEGAKANSIHYPGTYLTGGFNRRKSRVAGRDIENEDLVNLPNWLCMNFKPEDGKWLDFDEVEWIKFEQLLNVKEGIFTQTLHFRDPDGRETKLVSSRIVHMTKFHGAAIEWQLTPINWSGQIVVRSAIDGTVQNAGVARYRDLENQHLEILAMGQHAQDSLYLHSRTNQSHMSIAQAIRTKVYNDQKQVETKRTLRQRLGYIGEDIAFECQQGRTVRVEKIASLYTCRDRAICEPLLEAKKAATIAGTFEQLLTGHKRKWRKIWLRCDIELFEGDVNDVEAQFVLRAHIFHLLQTTSYNTIDLDAGVPARGLHGEAYRGHIFWDELFIFPFLNMRIPQLTRSLLLYRYRRLQEARLAAKEAGYRGAMYPWQSGSNGREESQVVHLNPRSGNWVEDNTYKQRHINAAIAYNTWQYYQVTNDLEFMLFAGSKMILNIALFWASIATYNEQRDRYEIHGIVGPDEFHTSYPDSDEPGLRNNAYTNVMAAWCLKTGLKVFDILPTGRRQEFLEMLGIDKEKDLKLWEQISKKMFVPFHDGDIISQFEGYEKLKEFDWKGYEQKYGDIQRLDRILESEGDSVNRYKAGKQADVLMLFYLFSSTQIVEMFNDMGYEFTPESIPRNIEYYRDRTSHGSTLSGIVHSWVLARSQRARSWDLFRGALMSDIADIQGGTTSEGIHLGAMAGTVDLVQRGYTGLETRDDVLWLSPSLPDELYEIKQRLHYRGHWIIVNINHKKLTVSLEESCCAPIKIGFCGEVVELCQGQSKEFDYDCPHRDSRIV